MTTTILLALTVLAFGATELALAALLAWLGVDPAAAMEERR